MQRESRLLCFFKTAGPSDGPFQRFVPFGVLKLLKEPARVFPFEGGYQLYGSCHGCQHILRGSYLYIVLSGLVATAILGLICLRSRFATPWVISYMWYRRSLRRQGAAQWPRTEKTAGAVFGTYHFSRNEPWVL